MELRILGCAGGSAPGRLLSGYLLDGELAVDAGSLTTALEPEEQQAVRTVLLTHAHLDHVWSFPLFLANRFTQDPRPVALHGCPPALDAVDRHLFNDEVWPKRERFQVEGTHLASFHPFEDGEEREVLPGWRVRAVGLDHTVPTQAFLVRKGDASLFVCGDTGPTDALWVEAARAPGLRALVLECSYPDREADLAHKSGHHTPSTLAADLRKLRRRIPVYVTHIKPEFHEEIVEALGAIGDDRLRILHDGQVHRIG